VEKGKQEKEGWDGLKRKGMKIVEQGVSHTVALLFTLKESILRQKKNYEIQIFHHAKIYS
jgi:hypothetical protein